MKPAYLLDANHVGLAVGRAALVGERSCEARLAGTRLGTRLPVLREIEACLRQVRHKVKYRHNLHQLLQRLGLRPVDLKTARNYGDLYMEFRRGGRVLSLVDTFKR